jgi:hypothetical protein
VKVKVMNTNELPLWAKNSQREKNVDLGIDWQ